MNWYLLNVVLHVLSALFWFGHMFFWSLVVGPAVKRIEPPETGLLLRQLSLRLGALGWPALMVLVFTGTVMLWHRGMTLQQFLSGDLFLGPFGQVLRIKFFLVGGMVLYQIFIGHRRAPRLIYLNMTIALLIVWLSVLLVRAPGLFL